MRTFVVGGAVRDAVMGLEPKDFDYLVVGGTHLEMIAQGFKQVGADFPVYLHPTTGEEYALARIERKTGDGYHGFEVDSSKHVTLVDDLSRRDLTINAMAREVGTERLSDPYGGLEDLEKKVLRHISDAFAEDPLRVVRLGRFYARYSDFTIAPETMELAKKMVAEGMLNHLPAERFWAELLKVFNEDRPDRFFHFLRDVRAFEHVHFFRETFGAGGSHHTETLIAEHAMLVSNMAKSSLMTVMEQDESYGKLMLHTAMCARADADIKDTRIATMLSLRSMTQTERDAESMFHVMQRARAFSEGTTWVDFLLMVQFDSRVTDMDVSLYDWVEAAGRARKVTAAQFPGVEGKALGEAIKQGRLGAVKEFLK